ncbi:type II toxin-antitoxin system prevent-host-death family antitoxin [Streptomyces sp. NPDC008240]|uniref:type II toxin-antitoxin system Phd/YefM family antitoxin n=1 Tax=Streptomyces sp. NPDC008240 TaxID=3364822 RepID=UPI0036E0CF8E
MSQPAEKRMGVSDARANMTEVIAEVRLLGAPVVLTRRDKPQAVLISVEAYEEAKALRKLVEGLKTREPELYEEFMAQSVLKPRTVRRRKPDDDIL